MLRPPSCRERSEMSTLKDTSTCGSRGTGAFPVFHLDASICEAILDVYGLPDAPRAWWEEITGFLRDECGLVHCRMDPAFMVFHHDNGNVGMVLVLHVDDIMIASDGSKRAEAMVEKIHSKYPFGEWLNVSEQESITYTG